MKCPTTRAFFGCTARFACGGKSSSVRSRFEGAGARALFPEFRRHVAPRASGSMSAGGSNGRAKSRRRGQEGATGLEFRGGRRQQRACQVQAVRPGEAPQASA
ncbi:hypothetical protein EVAR_46542_1 [Eumeta japonica]|uniref:Uncharacterized protein n=1 Tax=Eumeta variegata TaxID=151549 RepID=A0A4C1XNI3_EUMVA|nr:hypothetical protein EVAR_46542_1 [Eumeta japonica]